MRLYGSEMSPYVQRVLIVAWLKGHELASEPPPGGRLDSAEFEAISPARRIPALEIAPGRHLCESEAIAAYLDETLDGPPMLAGDAVARAHAREIAALAHNELAIGLRPVIEHDVFRMGGSAEAAAAGRAQVGRGLDAIERARDPANAYAASDTPGWADAMLAPVLAFVTCIDRAIDTTMLPPRPGLDAYLSRARGHAIVGRSVADLERRFFGLLTREA